MTKHSQTTSGVRRRAWPAGRAGAAVHDLYLPALPEMAGELNTSTAAAQLSLTAGLLGLASAS